MKKTVLIVLATLLISSCGFIPTSPAPVANIASPTTIPTETSTVPPTVTLAPATETFTLTPDVFPPTSTFTTVPQENLTTTVGAVTDTPTAISFPSSVTPTPTNGILTYGTLPPAVPSAEVILRNKSEAEAYISLQNQAKNGAILEYPVDKSISIRAPLGQYFYVAWVGGKKMTGSFELGRKETVTITMFKDRINIQK